MDVLQAFALNVRRLRGALGITQAELAAKLGVTTHTIFHYEGGARWPRSDAFNQLAAALGVEPWCLLIPDGSGPEVPPRVAELVAALARECRLEVSRPK